MEPCPTPAAAAKDVSPKHTGDIAPKWRPTPKPLPLPSTGAWEKCKGTGGRLSDMSAGKGMSHQGYLRV